METIAEMLEKRGEERGISLGEKRGEQRGKLENSREMLLEAVSERFGMVSSDLVRRINSIESHETLKMLFKQTFRMESLDEFKEQVHRATDN